MRGADGEEADLQASRHPSCGPLDLALTCVRIQGKRMVTGREGMGAIHACVFGLGGVFLLFCCLNED